MTDRARARGMNGGWSLGLSTQADEMTGRTWDLLKPSDQECSMKLLEDDQPELLIVSPPCTKFSSLQNLNKRPIRTGRSNAGGARDGGTRGQNVPKTNPVRESLYLWFS